MRKCSSCKEIKGVGEFYTRRGRPYHYCKPCWNKYMSAWSKTHPEYRRKRQREWVARSSDEQRAVISERNRKWQAGHPGYNYSRLVARPDRLRAKRQVEKAIRSGTLVRPERCERCGQGCKPEGHHADYEKPLEVAWLCRSCHGLTRRVDELVGLT